jgi:uncharacterized protein YwqG
MQLSSADAGTLATAARRHFGDAGQVLESAARESIRLHRGETCPADDARSRFGGTALLPPGHAWPRTNTGKPLSFLALVRTADFQAPAEVPGLPTDTLLAFFYEADQQEGWGSHPEDRQFSAVIPVPAASAVPVTAPPGALTFPAYRVLPRTVTTIPDQDEPALDELDEDFTAYQRLSEDLAPDDKAPWHRMFGWPDLVQDAMQLECQLASSGLNVGGPEGYRDPRAAGLAAGAADWLLLLQLDTDDALTWMWGDVGTIYYWIRRQDLLAGRFDQTWLIFQCC